MYYHYNSLTFKPAHDIGLKHDGKTAHEDIIGSSRPINYVKTL